MEKMSLEKFERWKRKTKKKKLYTGRRDTKATTILCQSRHIIQIFVIVLKLCPPCQIPTVITRNSALEELLERIDYQVWRRVRRRLGHWVAAPRLEPGDMAEHQSYSATEPPSSCADRPPCSSSSRREHHVSTESPIGQGSHIVPKR